MAQQTAAGGFDQPRTILGPGSEFNGKLNFEGTVRIDGSFTGEIFTNDTLLVGENAKVNANIACGTIIVSGEVNGNIEAKVAVEFHKPARIKGDVTTPSLSFEKGVFFSGTSKMVAEEESGGGGAARPMAAAGRGVQIGDLVVLRQTGLRARVMAFSEDGDDQVKVLMGSGPDKGSVVSVSREEISQEGA